MDAISLLSQQFQVYLIAGFFLCLISVAFGVTFAVYVLRKQRLNWASNEDIKNEELKRRADKLYKTYKPD